MCARCSDCRGDFTGWNTAGSSRFLMCTVCCWSRTARVQGHPLYSPAGRPALEAFECTGQRGVREREPGGIRQSAGPRNLLKSLRTWAGFAGVSGLGRLLTRTHSCTAGPQWSPQPCPTAPERGSLEELKQPSRSLPEETTCEPHPALCNLSFSRAHLQVLESRSEYHLQYCLRAGTMSFVIMSA